MCVCVCVCVWQGWVWCSVFPSSSQRDLWDSHRLSEKLLKYLVPPICPWMRDVTSPLPWLQSSAARAMMKTMSYVLEKPLDRNSRLLSCVSAALHLQSSQWNILCCVCVLASWRWVVPRRATVTVSQSTTTLSDRRVSTTYTTDQHHQLCRWIHTNCCHLIGCSRVRLGWQCRRFIQQSNHISCVTEFIWTPQSECCEVTRFAVAVNSVTYFIVIGCSHSELGWLQLNLYEVAHSICCVTLMHKLVVLDGQF